MFPPSLTAKYRVERKLGEGGMGTVYLATHLALDRLAAVKFVETTGFTSADAVARFTDEARVCARLSHRNVVQLYDFDLESQPPYLAMEYVEGDTLKRWIDEGRRLPVATVLELMAQVCDGLAHAHEQGIVHRDLKPENIMVTKDGVPKVTDFGLAKMGGVTSVKTRTGIVLGTPVYMSPEQAGERELTPSSDLYAMGVLLFELLAGTPPFDGPSDMDVLLKHLQAPPPSLSEFLPSAPPELVELVGALLAKAPAGRPSSAAQVAARLRRLTAVRPGFDPAVLTVGLGSREGAVRDRPLTPPTPETGRSRPARGTTGLRGGRVPRSTRGAPAGTGAALDSAAGTRMSSLAPEVASAVHDAGPRRRWPLVAIAVCLLVGAGGWLAGRGAGVTLVRDLEVLARGGKTLVLSWRSSIREEHPHIAVRGRDEAKPAVGTVGSCQVVEETTSDGARFHHTALLRGLTPDTEYFVAVAKPDGSTTLERSARTLAGAAFAPSPTVELTAEGTVVLRFESRIPFTATVEPEPLRQSPPPGEAWLQTVSWFFEPAALARVSRIRVTARSVDGMSRETVMEPRRALIDALDGVTQAFNGELARGTFYGVFAAANGARVNEAFHEAATRFVRLKAEDRAARTALMGQLWRDTTSLLERRSEWYPRLARLLPGLSAVLASPLRDDALAQAAARALVPLELVDSAAVWYNMEGNPAWRSLTGVATRPWPLRYDQPWLPATARTVQLDDQSLFIRLPFHFVYPRTHPKFEASVKSELIRARITKPEFAFELASDPSGLRDAEIEVVQRTACVSQILTVDVNEGAFVATVRDREQDWRAAEIFAQENHVYSKMGLLLIEWPFDDPTKLDSTVTYLETLLPPKPRRVYHRIPVRALRRGRNTVTLGTLSAPIDELRGQVVGGVSIRLVP